MIRWWSLYRLKSRLGSQDEAVRNFCLEELVSTASEPNLRLLVELVCSVKQPKKGNRFNPNAIPLSHLTAAKALPLVADKIQAEALLQWACETLVVTAASQDRQASHVPRQTLVALGVPAAKALIEAIGRYRHDPPYEDIGERFAWLLGKIGPVAVEPILTFVSEKAPKRGLLLNEVRAMGQLKDSRFVPMLVGELNNITSSSYHWEYRDRADVLCRALDAIGDPQLPVLEALRKAADWCRGDSLIAHLPKRALAKLDPHEASVQTKEKQEAEAKEQAARTGESAAIDAIRERLVTRTKDELVEMLRDICGRWARNQSNQKDLTWPAQAIGHELYRRGGMDALREAHRALGGIRGSRELDMNWNGIGDWRG